MHLIESITYNCPICYARWHEEDKAEAEEHLVECELEKTRLETDAEYRAEKKKVKILSDRYRYELQDTKPLRKEMFLLLESLLILCLITAYIAASPHDPLIVGVWIGAGIFVVLVAIQTLLLFADLNLNKILHQQGQRWSKKLNDWYYLGEPELLNELGV